DALAHARDRRAEAERVAHLDERRPAGPEHAPELAEREPRVLLGEVLKDAVGEADVERVIAKRKAPRVGDEVVCLDAEAARDPAGRAPPEQALARPRGSSRTRDASPRCPRRAAPARPRDRGSGGRRRTRARRPPTRAERGRADTRAARAASPRAFGRFPGGRDSAAEVVHERDDR